MSTHRRGAGSSVDIAELQDPERLPDYYIRQQDTSLSQVTFILVCLQVAESGLIWRLKILESVYKRGLEEIGRRKQNDRWNEGNERQHNFGEM